MAQEHKLVEMAYQKWEPIKNIHILGKSSAERLPIFSLVIEHPESKRFLHHNFVSSLLNDMFGIQARGGCACAGPYAEVCIFSFMNQLLYFVYDVTNFYNFI